MQSYSISPACLQLMIIVKKLCSYIFKVCVYPVFDNLESGKETFVLEKKCGKILEFWIQKSVRTLLLRFYSLKKVLSAMM